MKTTIWITLIIAVWMYFHLSYIMTRYVHLLHDSLCQNIVSISMSSLCTSVSWNIHQYETVSKKLKLSSEKLFCSFWDKSFYACGWQLSWCLNDLCGQIRLIPGSAWKLDICLIEMLIFWNPFFVNVYNGKPSTGKKVFLYWDHSCWPSARITSLGISKGLSNKFVIIIVFHDSITCLGIDTSAQHFRIRTSQIARFMGPTWAHLGPVSPRWAPCWPHEPCYQRWWPCRAHQDINTILVSFVLSGCKLPWEPIKCHWY